MRKVLLLLVVVLGLTGCGLQRQTVRINAPAVHIDQPSSRQIVVAEVTDSRSSLFAGKLDAAEQERNVGGVLRAGNGIVVDLEEGTATSQAKDVVVQALRSIGFSVVDEASASPSAPRLDLDLTQFGVNVPFEFWRASFYAQRMIADISTKVTLRQDGRVLHTFTVTGHGENIFQRVVPENWEIALNRAVADYTKRLQSNMVELQ
jgi:filamentous hemagglutinin family protein